MKGMNMPTGTKTPKGPTVKTPKFPKPPKKGVLR